MSIILGTRSMHSIAVILCLTLSMSIIPNKHSLCLGGIESIE